MNIRLEALPFEFDGKKFLLRCNMNVLADVQEQYGGDFGQALDGAHSMRSVMDFLAAMLNDYADEQGWPERYSGKDLGRKLHLTQIPREEIMGLVVRAITPPETPQEEATEGNPEEQGNRGN